MTTRHEPLDKLSRIVNTILLIAIAIVLAGIGVSVVGCSAPPTTGDDSPTFGYEPETLLFEVDGAAQVIGTQAYDASVCVEHSARARLGLPFAVHARACYLLLDTGDHCAWLRVSALGMAAEGVVAGTEGCAAELGAFGPHIEAAPAPAQP